MKKISTIVSLAALLAATVVAFAFKAHKKIPGNLYYVSAGICTNAPCQSSDNGGEACKISSLYSNAKCTISYGGTAYATDGGK